MGSTEIIVETARLMLRRFSSVDAKALEAVFCDPEVMQFSDNGVKSSEQIREWIGARIEQQQERENDLGPWAVVEKVSGTIIGYCGLFHLPDVCGVPEIEVGYRLARSHWGKGYATEAAQAVVAHAFDVLDITRLIAMIDPGNTASILVVEKLGMRYEKDVIFEGYTHPDRVYVIERHSDAAKDDMNSAKNQRKGERKTQHLPDSSRRD